MDIDVTSTSATLNLIENEFERPAGGLVEETLKKALFPLLKAAKQAAGRVKKDSEMSDVEID